MRNKIAVCERKKLYKSGKILVTAGIFSLAIFGATISDISADTTGATITTAAKADPTKDQPAEVQAASDKPVEAPTPDKVTEPQAAPDKTTEAPASDKATEPQATSDKPVEAPASDKATEVQATLDKPVEAPASDKATEPQVTSDKIAEAPAPDKVTSDKPADTTTGTPTKDQTSTVYAPANTPKTDKVDDMASLTDKKETSQEAPQLDKIESDSPNIKQIDGKTYFVDENGQVKKNFTAVVDGQVLYFDKTTGELTSNDRQYADGLTNIDNEHNAAYDLTSDSFTNVDGYLTANSWYRPKDILKSGTT